jgi:hypothetical protein
MSVTDQTRLKLTGICPVARGAVLAELVRTHVASVWLVIADELKTAEQLAEDVAFFHAAGGPATPLSVLVFPESQPDTRDMREAFAASSDRLTVLSKLRALRTPSGTQLALNSQLLIISTSNNSAPSITIPKPSANRPVTMRSAVASSTFTLSPPRSPIGSISSATNSRKSAPSIPSRNALVKKLIVSRSPLRPA